MVRPDVATSRRREMAKRVVSERGVSIRRDCVIFSVSETCYRDEAKKNAENEQIADWLLRLTDNHRNWGFGLCYLFLRNVKGFKWEPQADLSDLRGARAQPSYQASQAAHLGEA